MRKFPFSVYNSEGNVFVRRSSTELEDDGLIIARLLDNLVGRCLRLVDKIRVEDVKLVSLDNLGRRVIGATGFRQISLAYFDRIGRTRSESGCICSTHNQCARD